jgi:hypothetical protein
MMNDEWLPNKIKNLQKYIKTKTSPHEKNYQAEQRDIKTKN